MNDRFISIRFIKLTFSSSNFRSRVASKLFVLSLMFYKTGNSLDYVIKL